jgi:hypothetical protein
LSYDGIYLIYCFFVQDTVLMIPLYPYNLEDHHDVPLEDMWYASPQLFFTCALRPKTGQKPKNATYKTGPDDKTYSFVFFSTFEVLDLPIKGPMEDAGVTKLYEPSPELNSDDPSRVQQAQGFRLPVWLCRRSSC